MIKLLAIIGAIVLFMAVVGALGFADFYLCFRAVGECIRK